MAKQITGSDQSWTAFLTTAARLYKYPRIVIGKQEKPYKQFVSDEQGFEKDAESSKRRSRCSFTTALARLARFERAAFRLGDEKTVRLRCPSLCRKCLILLGF